MVQLSQLWLPILLSAVAVFIGSSIIWMALPIHKHEYKKLGDKEPAVLDAVRSWNLGGGMFMFPFCDPKDRNSPEAKEKVAKGPWGVMMLRAESWNMGQLLGLCVLNALRFSFVVSHIASHAGLTGERSQYLKVFQVVGATTFLAYGGHAMTDCIWKGRSWNTLPGALFDALVYAGLTAGVFGWK